MSKSLRICRKAQRPSLVWRLVGAGVVIAGVVSLVRWYRQPPLRPAARLAGSPAPSRLDEFLPEAEFNGSVSTTAHASPGAIFRALREVTLEDMPVAKLLGELRYLPSRLAGRTQEAAAAGEPFIKLIRAGAGNIILAEEPDRELVLGAAGKFHHLIDQQVVPLHTADEFLRFDQPDHQKLAMSIRVAGADVESGYRLTLEHRTHALDSSARGKFALYWIGIKPGGNFVSWLLLRAIKRRAEATEIAARKELESDVDRSRLGAEGGFDAI